jgi:hypothetical protein
VIRITLRGDPGHRTGTIDLDDQTYQIATWYRGGDAGHVNATSSNGEQITLALDRGNGGITIGRSFWHIRRAAWVGLVMTGETLGRVTDAEMARMFGTAEWP